MTQKHQYMIALAMGALAGFWAANAPSTTGIYSTFVGQTAADIYSAGAKISGATTATAA